MNIITDLSDVINDSFFTNQLGIRLSVVQTKWCSRNCILLCWTQPVEFGVAAISQSGSVKLYIFSSNHKCSACNSTSGTMNW